MPRRGGWRRAGSRGRFRYYDARGNRITDRRSSRESRRSSSRRPGATCGSLRDRARRCRRRGSTGRAGASPLPPGVRAQQEQAKYEKLIRFAERLPRLPQAVGEHMTLDPLDQDRVSAIAVRLINLTWFRVGSERYVREWWRPAALPLRERRRAPQPHGPQAQRLHPALHGRGIHREDFRTWGGTLAAAIAFAEVGDPPDTATGQKRAVAAVMRRVAERLGNTPAVTSASYVSPALVERYLDGRTIDDFRPRHLRVVGARDIGLDVEERALLSLLRSWQIRRSRAAA